jgi:hypothetical protein
MDISGFAGPSTSSTPEKVSVDLVGVDEMLELLEACIAPTGKNISRHRNFLKDLSKLLRSVKYVPLALKTRQQSMNLLKRDTITTIITVVAAQC